jgi:hypothetical protein
VRNFFSNAFIWSAAHCDASRPERNSVAPPAVVVATPPSPARTVDGVSIRGAPRSSSRAGPNAAASRRADASVGGADRASRSKLGATVVRKAPRAAFAAGAQQRMQP